MMPAIRVFPCPHCGWAEDGDASAHRIKPSTLLKERYYIGKTLGQGGFGITYLGWDTVLDVKIAIKEYFPLSLVTRNPDTMVISCADTSASEDFSYGLEKFLSEARILASFSDCPNIVSTRDFFGAYGTAYMVMEYIDGIDLKHYLDDHGGRMPWKQARDVVMHVADALRNVHSKGLLHRDVSPDNIFLTSRGQVKLLDFGAARFAFGIQNKSLSVVLKPGYAPVEQYQTRGNQGPWTDIYSLGATLYRSITGVLPPESLDRLETDVLASPGSLGISLPTEFEAAILTALALKPKDRFQSVQDFQNALTNASTAQADETPTSHASRQETVLYNAPTVAYKGKDFAVPSKNNARPRFLPLLGLLLAVSALLAFYLVFYDSNTKLEQTQSDTTEVAQGEVTALSASVTQPPAPERAEADAPEAAQSEARISGAPAAQANITEKPGAPSEERERLFAEAGLYATGFNRERDMGKALDLYERAAEAGHVGSMLATAAIYQLGQGVPIDPPKAADWYEKAAEAGSAEGALSLANLILEGSDGQRRYAKIVALLGRFADNDNVEASYLIGRAYEEGDDSLQRDLRQARNYYRLPARVKYIDAAERLEKISARLDS